MAKTSINYLFPPDQINDLPSWQFVLHFKAPRLSPERSLKQALRGLRTVEWKIINFPLGLENVFFDARSGTVRVAIEVPDARRRCRGSLADYESDVWTICGHMVGAGFGDMYYEAVDWEASRLPTATRR